MARKSKVSQHARLEVPKLEGFRQNVETRRFLHLQPDHLLFSDTRKEGKTLNSDCRKEKDKYRSMRSCDQTCNGEVGIIEQFMDRRHHFRLRQPGVNDMKGKNDMNGKNDTTGTDGGNGKNEYSFSEPLAACARFLHIRRCVSYISRTDIRECRVRDGM